MSPTGQEAEYETFVADTGPAPAVPPASPDGAGDPGTQSSDCASPQTRDAALPRRVRQPSQLRGQPAITPAQPGEHTLRHLRDVLDRLP